MIDRRTLLAAGSLALLPVRPARAAARKTLALELATGNIALAPGQPPTTAWRFVPAEAPHFTQGDEVDVTVTNRLPVPVLIDWRGLDGVPSLEPILARGPIPSGGSAVFQLSFTHAGTLFCDARLGGEGAPQALPVLPLIVAEKQPIAVDHDVALLIENWRAGENTAFTINGRTEWRLQAQPRDRVRMRIINGTQGSVLAAQLSGTDVRVLAIDGQPSEPFTARDGRLLLAPGTRIDAIVDAGESGSHALTISDGTKTTKAGEIAVSGAGKRLQALALPVALPSNGLPEKIALEQALRTDLSLDATSWLSASAIQPTTSPAFRAKRGRTVVLALANPTETTMVFHLHGHHMRLLDRLDDGWKPFWLDTMAIPPKQTVRMAFAATHAGAFLMETLATGPKPVQRLQLYRVDA